MDWAWYCFWNTITMNGIRKTWWNFWTAILAIISGLVIYEMAYCYVSYGNLLYNKTSSWLGIPHPAGWIWIFAIVVCIFFIVVLISVESDYER